MKRNCKKRGAKKDEVVDKSRRNNEESIIDIPEVADSYAEASILYRKKTLPVRIARVLAIIVLILIIGYVWIFDPFLWRLKPIDVYAAAVQKAAENMGADFTVNYDINYDYKGTKIHDYQCVNYRVSYGNTTETQDIAMHYISTIDGVNADYFSYYDDGMLYTDMNGEKSKKTADWVFLLYQSSILCPQYILRNPNLAEKFIMTRVGDVRELKVDVGIVAAKDYVQTPLSIFPELYASLPYFNVDSYTMGMKVDANTYEILEERLSFVLNLKWDDYQTKMSCDIVTTINSTKDIFIDFPEDMHSWGELP
ncbi:MAG: hypothetical protein RRY79_07050 [Clostridia bacterium]